MNPLADWPVKARRHIIGVFTDIDDTLTTEGSITPDALQALADLKAAGLQVIAITGRSAGWSEPFAKTWPVDAMVVENGALALQMVKPHEIPSDFRKNIHQNEPNTAYSLPRVLSKVYQIDAHTRATNQSKMAQIAQQVMAQIPGVQLTEDSSGRETDLAFDYNEFVKLPLATVQQVHQLLQQAGMQTTQSSIHIHGSFSQFDKWSGACWVLQHLFGRDLETELDLWVFVGDSGNDQAMFQHFQHSVGVANIRHFASQLQHLPNYITKQERGAGFAEVANAIINAKYSAPNEPVTKRY